MQDLSDIFAADGPLSKAIDGYTPRPAQQEMALAVSAALASCGRLLVEAGTGTGKTFAYLVPALLSGIRIAISTGTRNLQDQLFEKDLPLVCAALGQPVRTALLKGRRNYLCIHRLDLTREPAGHVSARIPGTDHLLIKARGPGESGVRYTTPDDVVEADLPMAQSHKHLFILG